MTTFKLSKIKSRFFSLIHFNSVSVVFKVKKIHKKRSSFLTMIWIVIVFVLLEKWTCLAFEPFGEHPEKAFYRFRSVLHNHLNHDHNGAITGTFKFKEVNLAGNGSEPRKQAWNVNGCFCHGAKSYCDCTSNPSTFRMMIKKKGAKRKQRKSTFSKSCYCDSRGCHGVSCERLSGCICDISGTCWGNQCPTDSTSDKNPNLLFSKQKPPSSVMNPVSNNEYLQESQTMDSFRSQHKLMSQQCNCNHDGCFGFGCHKMKGCACIGSKCWGDECNYGSLMNSYGRPNKAAEFASEQGISVLKGYPVESVIGYPIETIKSSQMDTIMPPQVTPIESQSMNPFDRASITSIFQKKLSSIEMPTATGEPMKTIIGSPIDSLIGMQIERYPSKEVHRYGSHYPNRKPFSDLKAAPIEKIRHNLHFFNNDRINPSKYGLEKRNKQKSEEDHFYKRTGRNESL